MSRVVSVLIPAHDEEAFLPGCVEALLASEPLAKEWQIEVLVIANGCTDDTADIARSFAKQAEAAGWAWRVLELSKGGKLGALNAGDKAAGGDIRVYIDADVTVAPSLLAKLVAALDTDQPRYASGIPQVAPAISMASRAYGQFWQTLPFVTDGVPGFGIFAVNIAGRERWKTWPDIISDDTFARLSFTPDERIRVSAGYVWPMVEGFGNLVRVRRRQNKGVEEIARLHPDLLANDDKRKIGPGGLIGRLLQDPVGFAVYAAVGIATKTPIYRSRIRWVRGR